MQTNAITVTGTLGPGKTITAKTFNNVDSINFDYLAQVLTITLSGKERPVQIQLDTIATVTYVIAGGVATVTIST